MAALVAVAFEALALTLALTLAMSTGQGEQLLPGPSVSRTVLIRSEQQQQQRVPLAVLRSNPSWGGGRSPSSLEIFAEDSRWASKVLRMIQLLYCSTRYLEL